MPEITVKPRDIVKFKQGDGQLIMISVGEDELLVIASDSDSILDSERTSTFSMRIRANKL